MLPLFLEYKQHGDPKAKERLLMASQPLLERVVKGFYSFLLMDEEDMRSVGWMGLLEAIENYDPDKGVKLETYATWRIRGAILDEMRRLDWVPRRKRELGRKVEQAFAELEQRHLRPATEKEVAEHLGLTEGELSSFLGEMAQFGWLSLSLPIGEEEEFTLEESIEDPNLPQPEERLHQQQLAQWLGECIERLPPKEKTVLALYYVEELTPKEIAQVMGLTPARISQLHSKAIFRLRGMMGRKKAQMMGEG